MFFKKFHNNFSLISYIFFNSLLSGLVLIGVCSSFALMLSENGVGVSTITNILLATMPYSWKFIFSPFVKNIINRNLGNNTVLKSISIFVQIVIFACFASLGFFASSTNFWLAGLIIFVLVIATCVHDIIRGYLKLTIFSNKELGVVSAIENTGFRIGILISGAGIVYISNLINWFAAFLLTGLIVIFVTISTLFMNTHSISRMAPQSLQTKSIKEYLKDCFKFLKEYNVIILLLVIISFKITDSCASILKPMLFTYLGVSKLNFANITHLIGTFSMIISGIVAGSLLYKIGLKNCVRITFASQMLTALIFMYLYAFKPNLIILTLLINVSTFVFGFSSVVFRTFASQNSQRDVNIYVTLLSLGSLIRIISYSFAGGIVDNYSWTVLYFLCLVSNIPGYFLYLKLNKRKSSSF